LHILRQLGSKLSVYWDSWAETTAIMRLLEPTFAHTETVGIKIERVLGQLGRNYSDNEATGANLCTY